MSTLLVWKDQKAKITVEIQEQSYTQEELQRVFDTAGKKLGLW